MVEESMERIGFLIDEEDKLRWKAAALLTGQTLTALIFDKVEPEVEHILLSKPMGEVSRAFAAALKEGENDTE